MRCWSSAGAARSGRPLAARGARWLLALALVAAASLVAPAGTGGQSQIKGKVIILAGFDLFETAPGTTISLPGDSPLPAGFFDPGSEPFDGTIPLAGVPIGSFHGHPTGETDTIVHRLESATLPSPSSSDAVPIELVALSLHSVQPITVRYLGGTEKWDVSVGLSPTDAPSGSMTIHGHDRAGGTFDSTLPVVPRITFTRFGDREQRVLDVGKLPASNPLRSSLELKAHHVPYTYDFPGRLVRIHGLNAGFCAGCKQHKGKSFSESSALARHRVHVPPKLARIPAGFDIFQTQPSRTSFRLPKTFPIPGGFFGTGSEPFSGPIRFEGVPIGLFHGHDIGDADTVVQRRRSAHVGPGNGRATVPIELVQLQLQSTEPIKVRVGNETQSWNVTATVSDARPSSGKMTISKRTESGGTFSSHFHVFPVLTFTNAASGATRTLDIGKLDLPKSVFSGINFKAKKVPWQKECREPALHVPGLNDDFCPSFSKQGTKILTTEEAKFAKHGIMPAQPIRLPPIDCSFAPPMVAFPPGGGGNADCVIHRIELPHSFFPVNLNAQAASVPGLGVQLTAPKTNLRRGETTTLHVAVNGLSGVQPGNYDVPILIRESAGADQAKHVLHLPVVVQAQCQDGSDNDSDGKTDLADLGCANAQDNNEVDPTYSGMGTGSFSFGPPPPTVNWIIQFNQPTTGFKIVVPPASGPTPRTVSNGQVTSATGFTCAVTTTLTTNDSLQCTGNLPPAPLQGHFDTNPPASGGMGGQLYGYQSSSEGTATGGPFTMSGP